MKILLHTCCGPCTIFSARSLMEKGFEVFGFYYNPNIHPYQEWERRLEALQEVAHAIGGGQPIQIIVRKDYPLEEFLRNIAFREENRCIYCYTIRLEATAKTARKSGFDAFTTTLLYSKRQKHDLVREIAESVSKKFSIKFHYEDFREGWKRGQEEAARMGIYRQQYCGCIYSEKERFYKKNR